jgi:creatinine amidohydrolase/Fe(II)-dependent formamide hydrolase-like protein
MTQAFSRLFHLSVWTLGVAGVSFSASSQVLQLGELNTEQIGALDHQRTVVIIPIAILEEHGPYLPSYTDGYKAERLTRELADAIAARSGWTALLFPPIPLGNGGANQIGQKWIFPGSYTVRAETIRAVLMDLAAEFGEQGFRWVFLVTLHGAPNHHKALDQASDYFRDQYGGHMVNLCGLMPVRKRGEVEVPKAQAAEDGLGIHSGIQETSDLLFLRPDLVAPAYRNARSITGRDMAHLVRLAQQDDWPGYFGAPRFASASHGARSWRHLSDKACSAALEILDGADYRAIPRWGEVADQDPATLAVDRADSEQDERVAEQQRRWLQRKGLQ